MDPESSVELLQLAKAGDRTALDRLIDRYWDRIHRWTSGRLPPHARSYTDTDDIVQEALMGLAENLDTFEYRGEWSIQAYLRTVAGNRIRAELRKQGTRPVVQPLPDGVPSPGLSPHEAAVGREVLARYDQALEELTPVEREAVVAWVEMGFSYKEVAELVGKPSPDAARMFVTRALEKLATTMAALLGRGEVPL